MPGFAGQVEAFLLHPFGDLYKSVETGCQSGLQPAYAMPAMQFMYIGHSINYY
jgi:hypothetical protein